VLEYALIEDFITFRNEGLHLGLGMVATSKPKIEFEIWEQRQEGRLGFRIGYGRSFKIE